MPIRRRLTDAEILAQIPAARARAAVERQSGLRALSGRYDRRRRRVVLELTNGYALAIPITTLPPLADASTRDLAGIQLGPGGAILRFPSLDADYSVRALVIAMTARETGRQGGRARTDAKSRAAKANGAKGGRPRKKAAA